jgi:hypothetical protein
MEISPSTSPPSGTFQKRGRESSAPNDKPDPGTIVPTVGVMPFFCSDSSLSRPRVTKRGVFGGSCCGS